ncbi:TPM domain-containing protein [Bifidobacterium callimiconis]|uniref:TPM domain-containing protein n=1 Tax=Bifidobacterium callimiconis TaxID=2306973 RepID=A0A430FGE9_9BIFI|nr:TPM domain-containing protein [Bifidobacterium callimiconis]MBT1176615.1 TPM domain-containing protein [Bifidobacterium callimiconis]RSX51929.1 hypothetical protein D2E23_0536 [Bifidobacterium callimiconis]
MERTTPRGVIGMIIALVATVAMTGSLMMAPAPLTWADDATDQSSQSTDQSGSGSEGTQSAVTVTDNITDTENLLGDNLGKVTDAIDSTKQETGVTVKLLYLPKFAEGKDPEEWATDVLNSTNPEPNTVLLAVASEDGNLVVAISKNSDKWLQDAAGEMSSAALKPLTEGDTPDWSGSAIALTDQIKAAKTTSTPSAASHVGVVIFIVALVVLVVAAGVFFVLHKKGHSRAQSRAEKQLARRQRRRSKRGGDTTEPDTSTDTSSNSSETDDSSETAGRVEKDGNTSDADAADGNGDDGNGDDDPDEDADDDSADGPRKSN